MQLFSLSSLFQQSSICFLHLTNPPQSQTHRCVLSGQRSSWSHCAQPTLWLALALLGGKTPAVVVNVLQPLFSGSCVRNTNHDHTEAPGKVLKMLLFALVNMVQPALCVIHAESCYCVFEDGDGQLFTIKGLQGSLSVGALQYMDPSVLRGILCSLFFIEQSSADSYSTFLSLMTPEQLFGSPACPTYWVLPYNIFACSSTVSSRS